MRKITTILLAMLLLFNLAVPAFAVTTEDITLSATSVTLPQYEKKTITAAPGADVQVSAYQWQIKVPGTDLWVDISGAKGATLELSYAMTIHKAMGSEYDTVIIPMLPAHKILLTRNLIYTAITRAKRRVLLVGQKKALFMAIHKTNKGKRNTLLGERMSLYYKALTHSDPPTSRSGDEQLKKAS